MPLTDSAVRRRAAAAACRFPTRILPRSSAASPPSPRRMTMPDPMPPADAPTLEPSAKPKRVSIVEQTIIGTTPLPDQSGDTTVRPFRYRATDDELAGLKERIA